jgi:osmotically inducible protein OsmC
MQRKASAVWQGGLKDGKGTLTTESKALSGIPYSFGTRFEGVPGTNPEELLGAAHAGCFSMALSMMLGEAGIKPERIDTTATITFEKLDTGFTITRSHLDVAVKAPGADAATFAKLAEAAKVGCPISRLLAPGTNITMTATLA